MSSVPTRPLGSSDIAVSVVGLGANNFGGRIGLEQARRVLDAALDLGITHVDTADVYGRHFGGGTSGATRSEQFLGELLRGRRDRVVLATKFGGDLPDGYPGPRGAPAYITRAVDASLTRLQTDHIDLYWYHRPDGVTPVAETFGALAELQAAGKIRAAGASNFTAAQLEEAAPLGCVALQNEYSLLHRDPESDGTLAACDALDVAFIPYFPLASGLLSGKYTRDGDRPQGARLTDREELASGAQWDLVERTIAFAAARGLTSVQVAIGALLGRPAVASVIAGATTPDQVVANAAAAQWSPTAADLSELLG